MAVSGAGLGGTGEEILRKCFFLCWFGSETRNTSTERCRPGKVEVDVIVEWPEVDDEVGTGRLVVEF